MRLAEAKQVKEMPYRVLFLEDDPTIREVLTEYMLVTGYQVITAERGDRALEFLKEQTFDLAVLDICVPGVNGFEVLKSIHESGKRTAVIMLTALEDEQTQVKAFNLYADDYVIKPVSPIILLKRMETILRRTTQNAADERGQEKGLILQEEAYCAFYGGEKLPLTLTEYLLLHRLWQEPNRVFTREQLILSIFNEDYIGNDRIIDAHVKNLRKKLPASCIKTIIGVGYQFDREAGGL
ncbi:response regulator transcription factor [Acetatifactor muris]|uniref:Stage 0 sporulation protein A homolog n=1 Tax=Acetatifactor muris TaxID=879566 RepID=A0A2K4ZFX4_9FIRM|nr:response regulator transcription factor [Acetatifactor muris]MCR2047642.1 response regulator transcription factor [Acetatifactor muris]SOY29352.1 Transcriptional regulatory protein BaeR [Acetatifactor muris]